MKPFRLLISFGLGLLAMIAVAWLLHPIDSARARPAVSTTIMIHEFEADTPQAGIDTAYEWFELYNASTSTITLTNWTISDAQSSDVILTAAISPQGFLVVAASISFTTNYPAFTGTIVYLGGSIGNGLANGGDCLTLADDTGTIIDQVTYGSNTCGGAFNLGTTLAGQSWEREPIGQDTDTANDWVKRNVPTPGYGYTLPPEPPLTPPGSILFSAVHFSGYAIGDDDEGFRLTNVSTRAITLPNWVAVNGNSEINLTGTLSPDQAIWIAKSGSAFESQFGYKPAYEYGAVDDPGVPNLAINGSVPALADNDKLVLREGVTNTIDVVIWGNTTLTDTQWVGPNVQRYSNTSIGSTGQIIYRKLDEATGRIVTDTNTAQDWANDRTDPVSGRKVQYPGWDIEKFWQTAKVTGTATLTVAITPDNGYRVISDVLSSAQSSIKMEMHTFDNLGLLNVLTQTIGRGVSVTILLEGGPAGGIDDQELWVCDKIEAAGGQCWFMVSTSTLKIYDRYEYLHAKMIVVDDRVVAIGSENFSPRALAYDNFADGTVGHRGVYLVTDATGVVSRALEIWNADFDPAHYRDLWRWTITDTVYGPPPSTFLPITNVEASGYRIRYPQPLTVTAPMTFELLTAPESALRASDSLLGLINRSGAGDTIDVEQLDEPPYWGSSSSNPIDDPNVRLQALIDAANRGAKVRLLLDRYFDDATSPTSNAATRQYIDSLGAVSPTLQSNFEVRLGDPALYGIHNKMFWFNVGGHKIVHAGSLNGTETSNKVNREVALQVESSAAYDYLQTMFEYDWAFQPRVYFPLIARNYVVPVNHLLISKVFYLGFSNPITGSEWVQLYNPTPITLSLAGYKIGDQAVPGLTTQVDGMWQFPPTGTIAPGQQLNIGLTAAGFFNKYGFLPHYAFFTDAQHPAIPLTPYLAWTSNISFSLSNSGDEVLLLNANDQLVDGVAWGIGSLPGNVSCLAINPADYPLGNPSIKRDPLWKDSDNCPNDFVIDETATP
jgi:phosphatidylserine/phosphatidylglycerophosphate/cardiolipin synthase-like enzyme